jgi:hypothetical protein
MRWILPGGAVLGGSNRGSGEPPVACRPGTAVLVRMSRREATVPEPREVTAPELPRATPTAPTQTQPDPPRPKLAERLATVKLLLEVLAVLVGLIGAILALLGLSRK